MSSIYGEVLKLSLFGESHGKAIGAVLDGFPSGFSVNNDSIGIDILRRSSAGKYGSGRNETDQLKIISGINDGKTQGTPIMFLFENSDVKITDYNEIKNIIRPGHSDFTSQVRYKKSAEETGGGHLSGRLTAPLTAAGSLCKQYLESKYKLSFLAKVIELGGEKLKRPVDPTIEESAEINLLYEKAKMSNDSYGAIIKIIVSNLPAGLGSPIFDNVESKLSQILYGIPGLKGLSFGLGFDIAGLKGSQANDIFFIDKNDSIKTKTNNAGGILGGITNGMPLVINLAFKPTPTVGVKQKTVNIKEMAETEFLGKGRHDVCYALRLPPVVEGAVSIALLDMLIQKDGYSI